MRRLLTASLLAMTLAASSTSFAKSFGFNSTITEPLTSAVKIEVVLSKDLAHRANHLPKRLRDRNNSRRLNAGFANNGFYGERELQHLTERLQSKIEQKFAKKNIAISDTATTVLRVTLEDVKPNRPTFEQLSQEPGLSFQSIGIGGAEITSELIKADGDSLGKIDYKWYESNFHEAQFNSTWTDAHRAFNRYANKAAKTLAN